MIRGVLKSTRPCRFTAGAGPGGASFRGRRGQDDDSDSIVPLRVFTKVVQPVQTKYGGETTEDRIQRMAAGTKSDGPPRDQNEYQPLFPREWVTAPLPRLSTAANRSRWYRFMQFNAMCDSWTDRDVPVLTDMVKPKTWNYQSKDVQVGGNVVETKKMRTTPVSKVKMKIPTFLKNKDFKPGTPEEEEEFVGEDGVATYVPEVDPVPPHLRPEYRLRYLVEELKYYSPDIFCINELNTLDFYEGPMWKYIRYQGYGCTFVSSRGRRVMARNVGQNVMPSRQTMYIPVQEDIGTAIYYHKARFTPVMHAGPMGAELPITHFAHFVALRDKVASMTIFLACVHFTAGNTPEAVNVRAFEARSTISILEEATRLHHDEMHGSVMICGDLNCVDEEEPCVKILRDRLFSSYDIVGGPRWTAWYHEKDNEPNKYFSRAVDLRKECEKDYAKRENVVELRAQRGDIIPSRMRIGKKKVSAKEEEAAKVAAAEAVAEEEEKSRAAANIENNKKELPPLPVDAIALEREVLKRQGVVKRAQDYIFFDMERQSMLRVLNTPSDDVIDKQILLPCRENPSHHVALAVDMCWNDTDPNY